MRRVLALTLVVGVSSAPHIRAWAYAAGQATASPLIRIDAVVTDAEGRPVTDLKPGDFTLLEDGAAEKIDSVMFVSANGAGGPDGPEALAIASRADESAEAARSGARLFAIFLDEYHVARGAAADRARDVLLQFVQHDMGPRDLAIVVKPLDSLLTFQLTHSGEALTSAIDTFQGRKDDYTPTNPFEQNYIAAAPSRVEQVRSQIVISALNALATHLGVVGAGGSGGSGRKTIIVVSEGLVPPPRRHDDPLPTVDSAARTANRQGVSFYMLDPRAFDVALPADPHTGDATSSKRDALRGLVDDTDGRAMVTAADVESGMAHLLTDASAYYMVAFQPAHPTDFRVFHPVELHVTRANVTLHARKGYWSASADDLLRVRTETRAETPKPPPQPLHHASPLIHPWFGLERGSGGQGDVDGRMHVRFVWEPVPAVPGDRVRTGPPSLVSVKATNAIDGATVFEGEVRPANTTAPAAQDAPVEATFDVKPGRLLVQIAIRDADQHLLDTDVRDVIVGALAGPVEVGTPEVLSARSAREYRALDADRGAVPVATRDFSREERLLIRVPVYGRDPSIGVTAALANKIGGTMRALTATPIPGTWLYEIDLPLASLAAGEYTIQIAATGATGNARDAVAFRVVP